MTSQGRSRIRVGFVGLGELGAPMAVRNLRAGIELRVFARRSAQTDPLVEQGAGRATSIPELAAESDVLCICVKDDIGVEEVFTAGLPHLARGSTVIVHSTIHPDTVRLLSKRAESVGVRFLDAPVSGGAIGARAGTSTVMVGGEPADLERTRPLLESFAGLLVHAGSIGAERHSSW
jgi:3-hydroxyisobutyrate dehydrogenase